MEFREQPRKLPVTNFDKVTEQKSVRTRHDELLPDIIRAVFCGTLNCGKTNALLALITHPNGLRFENVYVYSKCLNQPKYKYLEKLLTPVEGIEYLAFSEHDRVVSPADARPNSIIIFDDIACENRQDVVSTGLILFTVSTLHIQSYTANSTQHRPDKFEPYTHQIHHVQTVYGINSIHENRTPKKLKKSDIDTASSRHIISVHATDLTRQNSAQHQPDTSEPYTYQSRKVITLHRHHSRNDESTVR